MIEEWRPVVGYDGYYEVSNLGRVRSVGKLDGAGKFRKGRIRKQKISRTGYMEITLSKDTALKTKKVHRIVAEAFIPNPQNLPFVNHKDESRTNNCVDNLEWITPWDNAHYGTAQERLKATMPQKIKNLQKPVVQSDLSGNVVSKYESITEAEEKTGVNKSHIVKCCKGKLTHTGGYRWSYDLSEK